MMGPHEKNATRSLQKYREAKKKPSAIASDQNLLIQLLGTAKRDPKQIVIQGDPSEGQRDLSYGDFLDLIEQIASGLLRLKVAKGDRIAILSENRPEWTLSDFSILAAGGITVPVYNTLSPQQMAYELKQSQARILFLSNGPHMETVRKIRGKLPHLKQLIVFGDSLPPGLSKPDRSLLQLMKEGASDRRPLEIMASQIGPEDPATIVYTSATGSSNPRGVLLTHKNFLAQKKALERVFNIEKGHVLLSYLPLAHILQRVVDVVAILGQGRLAYCPEIDRVQEKLREVRPHILVGVPRTYEKIQHTIMENVFYSGPPVKEIYQRIFRWIEANHREEQGGRKKSSVMDLPLNWVKKSAENKIRDRLGGRIRSFFVAGAPLPPDLETFFEMIRIPLFNVYGMTELTGAITANCPDRNRSGTAGIPLPGVELRIQEDGEILVRGDTVMAGYYQSNKPPKRAVNAQGWFATGDIGRTDEDGFLTITGRKKDILITAAGKNIAPQPIERRLRLHPFIKQAMIVGDGRRFLCALIVPSFSKLNEYALKHRILYLNHEELLEHPKILSLYEGVIRDVNKDLSRFETLKKFCLLPEPFTTEAGEMTPTQRLRRKVIEKRYRDEVDGMYWGTD